MEQICWLSSMMRISSIAQAISARSIAYVLRTLYRSDAKGANSFVSSFSHSSLTSISNDSGMIMVVAIESTTSGREPLRRNRMERRSRVGLIAALVLTLLVGLVFGGVAGGGVVYYLSQQQQSQATIGRPAAQPVSNVEQ